MPLVRPRTNSQVSMEKVDMEIWRPVVEYEGVYEVSSLGHVRSVTRVSSEGKVRKGALRKLSTNNRGYLEFSTSWNHKRGCLLVHQVVAAAFISPRPNAASCVLHRDDDKFNNAVSNLYWGSQSENAYDRVRNGHDAGARRTRCVRGHEFNSANTYYRKSGGRNCRKCAAIIQATRRARAHDEAVRKCSS